MATTSPDNIYSADDSTILDIPAITGAMAASIQAALNERGNSFTGTSNDRNDATNNVGDGTIWVDTNGDKKAYVKQGGAWVPLVPERHFFAGRIWSGSSKSIPSGGNHTFTWTSPFTQIKGVTHNANGLVVPRTGWYQVSGGMRWDGNTSGRRQLRVMVGGDNVGADYISAASLTAQSLSLTVRATQGDAVSLVLSQDSGSTVTTRTDLGMPYLSIAYLGE